MRDARRARARHARRGPRRRGARPRDRARRARDRRSTRAISRPFGSTGTPSSSSSRGRPRDRIVVAESGVHSRAQGAAAELAGADAILVGSALMQAPDPAAKLARAPLAAARQGLRAHARGGCRRRGRGGRRSGRLRARPGEPARGERGAPRARRPCSRSPSGSARRARAAADLDQVHPREEGKVRGRDAAVLRDGERGRHAPRPALGERTTRATGSAPPRPPGASCSQAGSGRQRRAPRSTRVHPWAVDASSRARVAPGRQGSRKVRAYVEAARA